MLVIGGIYQNMDVQHVKDNVLSVFKVEYIARRDKKRPLPLVMVTLLNTEKNKPIYSVEQILKIGIVVERPIHKVYKTQINPSDQSRIDEQRANGRNYQFPSLLTTDTQSRFDSMPKQGYAISHNCPKPKNKPTLDGED